MTVDRVRGKMMKNSENGKRFRGECRAPAAWKILRWFSSRNVVRSWKGDPGSLGHRVDVGAAEVVCGSGGWDAAGGTGTGRMERVARGGREGSEL